MNNVLLISDKSISKNIVGMFPKDSGLMAVDSLKQAKAFIPAKWDAVLLDIDMKEEDYDSYAFLQEAKESNPSNEYIVFSCVNDAKKCIKAMSYGAYNYLIHPFQKSALFTLIEAISADDKQVCKSIENLVHSHFISNLEDRKTLLNELIHSRRLSGSFVSPNDFLAFFSSHESSSSENISLLREYFGDKSLKELKKETDPPVILVVEDEPNVREGILDILHDNGFETLEAKDGQMAIEVAKEAKKIDLNLLDIGLPGKTGIELIPILRDLHPHSETIMLTAYADQIDYVINAFKDHAYDYLTKPYDKSDLLVKISKAIQKAYFKQLLPEVGKIILDKNLSAASKFKILTDIARKRHRNNRHLSMKEIYLFFPELEQSKIPRNRVLTESIIEDGILLFVDFLSKAIHEGQDCKYFIEKWESNF